MRRTGTVGSRLEFRPVFTYNVLNSLRAGTPGTVFLPGIHSPGHPAGIPAGDNHGMRAVYRLLMEETAV